MGAERSVPLPALLQGRSYLLEHFKRLRRFVFISVIKQLTEWDTCLKLNTTLGALLYIEFCGLGSCGWSVPLLSVLPWLALLIRYPFPALADSFLCCFFLELARGRGGEPKNQKTSQLWLIGFYCLGDVNPCNGFSFKEALRVEFLYNDRAAWMTLQWQAAKSEIVSVMAT